VVEAPPSPEPEAEVSSPAADADAGAGPVQPEPSQPELEEALVLHQPVVAPAPEEARPADVGGEEPELHEASLAFEVPEPPPDHAEPGSHIGGIAHDDGSEFGDLGILFTPDPRELASDGFTPDPRELASDGFTPDPRELASDGFALDPRELASAGFALDPRELASAGFTPDLPGLAQELARAEPPPRRPQALHPPEIDDLRDPGTLASDPPVPRALDALTLSTGGRRSRSFDAGTRSSASWSRSVLLWMGIAAGLLLGLVVSYLLWAATVQLIPAPAPPTTVAEVRPAAPAPQRQAAATPRAPNTPAPVIPAPAPATPAPAPATPVPAPVIPAPASVPPVEPSRPAAAAKTGLIRVRSTPSTADVFVDGKRLGVTPKNLGEWPFGTHTIRVTRPGYVPQERVVTLDARQTTLRVEFTLPRRPPKPASGPAPAAPKADPKPAPKPAPPSESSMTGPPPAAVVASISIETRPPGVRVRLDGKDIGVTPITISPVEPGAHAVELQRTGYRTWSTTVTVAAGKRQRITASLERNPPR
jgi:hypothetical protein